MIALLVILVIVLVALVEFGFISSDDVEGLDLLVDGCT